MRFYTYAHYTLDTGQLFYIGKGSRADRAYNKSNRSVYWNRIVNKHGLKVEILSHFETESEAYLHEIFLIETFKRLGVKLCNIASGGEGRGLGNPSHKGRKFTDEHKQKISASKAGLKSPDLMYRIIGTSLETGDETIFIGTRSLVDAGFQFAHVYKCCDGKRKTHKGHTFRKELLK